MHDANAEADFRWRYDRVDECTTTCYNGSDPESPCTKACHYLIANDIDGQGYPPVLGLDCSVSVVSWGGDDVHNSTIQAYCSECALAEERWREQKRIEGEAQSQLRREAVARELAAQAERNRQSRQFWLSLSDLNFEIECAELFRGLGYIARTTSRTNDNGVDILLENDGRRGAAQCKAWANPSGVQQVREFYGALHAENMSFGYFISRGGFTPRAKLLVSKMPLLTGWTIDDLVQHGSRKP